MIKTASIGTPAAVFQALADNAAIFTIHYTSVAPGKVNIKIINMNGQVAHSSHRNMATGTNTFKLSNVSRPSAGLDIVLLEFAATQVSAKIKW